MALYTHSLISLAEAKGYTGLNPSVSEHDDFINDLCNAVTDLCESTAGRHLKTRGVAVTEVLDGPGTRILQPAQFPIDTVTDIRVDANRVFGADTIQLATDYGVGPARSTIRGYNLVWPSGWDNIQITYTYGMGGVNTRAVPEDLKLAAKMVFMHQLRLTGHNELGKGMLGQTSFTKEGEGITFTEKGAIPEAALKTLLRYRVVSAYSLSR